MAAEGFQLWYKLIEAAEKLGDTHYAPFWDSKLCPGGSLQSLEGKYRGSDLVRIWKENVEPRLEKLLMDSELRRRFKLPRVKSCPVEWMKVSPKYTSTREWAHKKLAKFRIGEQMELVETERCDWPGRNWGFPDTSDSEELSSGRTSTVSTSSSEINTIMSAFL